MVQPERVPGEEAKRARTPRAALIGATVGVVLAGAFGLGRLTAPSPEAGETSTTTTIEPSLSRPTTTTTTLELDTFRVADIATGRPIRWIRGPGLGGDIPVSIVEHADRLLMFAWTDPPAGPANPAGLRLWTSDEGVFWLNQGEVIGSQYSVDKVVSNGARLFALGRETATDSVVLFTSTDASSWTAERLPAPRELAPGENISAQHVIASAETTLVFGSLENDPFQELDPYLPDEVAMAAREHGMSWDGPPYRFWIHIPWGITAYTATAEELGVPDDVVVRLNSAELPETYVWKSSRVGSWEVSDFEADWIESATIDESGSVTVFGHGTFRPMVWTSEDGVAWETSDDSRELHSIVEGPTGLAGIGHTLFAPDVAISSDGAEWKSAGVADLLPSSLEWDLEWLAGADSGLAVLARGFHREFGQNATQPVASLQRNGYEMKLDLATGVVEVSDAGSGDTLLLFSVWGEELAPGVEIDLTASTLTVLDQTDEGEALATFGFDEMLAAESAAWATSPPEARELIAFLFSPDGENWSIQDMSEAMAGDRIVQMLVADDRILAVSADRLSQVTASPFYQTWLGLVPPG